MYFVPIVTSVIVAMVKARFIILRNIPRAREVLSDISGGRHNLWSEEQQKSVVT